MKVPNHSVHGCLFNQEDNPFMCTTSFICDARVRCALFVRVSACFVWNSMIRGLSSTTRSISNQVKWLTNQPTRPIPHCDSLPSLLWEWGTEMLILIDILFDHGPCRLPFFLPSFILLPSCSYISLMTIGNISTSLYSSVSSSHQFHVIHWHRHLAISLDLFGSPSLTQFFLFSFLTLLPLLPSSSSSSCYFLFTHESLPVRADSHLVSLPAHHWALILKI